MRVPGGQEEGAGRAGVKGMDRAGARMATRKVPAFRLQPKDASKPKGWA